MQFFSLFLTLLLVQDPIGNIPVCLGLLRTVPKKRHAWLIIRENLIALFISSFFLVSGNRLLSYLHITLPGLGITGGIVLFVVAFKMIFPSVLLQEDTVVSTEPFIVPLAIPLLAGPSMIATVTLYGAQYPAALGLCFAVLVGVSITSTAVLLLSLPLYRWLGPQLIQALERLMGIILMAIATQTILDNLYSYYKLAVLS